MILGISAFYHDSAAALLENGRVIAAAEEERFSRAKHDNGFPFRAVDFCLKNAGVKVSDLEAVAYYEKPLLKFERIMDTFVRTYPFSLRPFVKSIPEWLTTKIKVEKIIKRELGFKGKIFFIPHHLSHAAAAFYPSPFDRAAVLTIDGVGEYQTTALWQARRTEIKPIKEINFPDSLGLLYSTLTAFLGFKVNDDEYKVMGLAAYGKPDFEKEILKTLVLNKDGSFSLNMDYFHFREGFQMWKKKLERLLGSARRPDEPLTERHQDIAASIQTVTEDIYFRMLNHLYVLTKIPNLCVGGGVALNSLANGKIYERTPFKKVYIFGPAGDGGAALGAAFFAGKRRHPVGNLSFGSSYNDAEIETALKKKNLSYKRFENEEELVSQTASLLAEEKIIGWFQGRMELGPRALGNRSILAHPGPAEMKTRVNEIKRREEFRPFACSILEDKVHEYFNVPDVRHRSPFMNFCFQAKKDKAEKIAAVVHHDRTSRIQTVTEENGRYFNLIREFQKKTGLPCILNTSFNVKGEPIVESPEQAIRDFTRTPLGHLVIGNFLVSKG